MRLLTAVLLVTFSTLGTAQTSGSRTGLASQLGAGNDAGFVRADTPRRFVFPNDHGPHPDFRNEWWYVTGNLDSDEGRRFGYELTFFRVALQPGESPSASNWRINEVWFAHFALTDAGNDSFRFAERFARGAAGLAGAAAQPLRVWLEDWSIEQQGNTWRLAAQAEDFAIDVELDAVKPPVLNGDQGLSQKSIEQGNASYYYSITRLATTGQLRSGSDTHAVTGTSWLDREWSTSALGADQVGWDWFALHLDDGSDLMYYQLRRQDGSIDRHSAGTLTNANGVSRQLVYGEVELRVTATWTNERGEVYPAAWQFAVPAENIELDITPVVSDQELDTIVRYWEGAVDVTGTRNGSSLTGRGYVELTGYAE